MKKRTPPKQSAESYELRLTKAYSVIKLAIDWHAAHYRVVRIIDGAGPEPAQRFAPADFLKWVKKQKTLAEEVYSCYEAGAGGFVLHRQLESLGVVNYVIVPRKLDPDRRGVQTDRTDAMHLAQDLDRYVRGNPKALRLVKVPTVEQEAKRQPVRQRRQLCQHRLALAAQGRCLLLSQGWRESNGWWKPDRWERLQAERPEALVQALRVYWRLIQAINEELEQLTQQITVQAAAQPRPVGMGVLSLEEIDREVCDWHRFKNRKQPGSYVGLVGGVSSSANYLREKSITKAGHGGLRTLLIEMAWRMVRYQPRSRLIQKWGKVFFNPKASKRARKRAIVAVARQLMTELWRWRTGQRSPEELGWQMLSPARV